MIDQMTQQKIEFEDMQLKLGAIENYSKDALDKANSALEKVTETQTKMDIVVEKSEEAVKKSEETLKRADAALSTVENKVDRADLGFTLTEDMPTVKAFINKAIEENRLTIKEF